MYDVEIFREKTVMVGKNAHGLAQMLNARAAAGWRYADHISSPSAELHWLIFEWTGDGASPTPNAEPATEGWHPDPAGRHEHRYHDGQRWTDHVADGGEAKVDSAPAPS